MNFTDVFIDTEMQTVVKVCTPCTKVLNEGNEGEQVKSVTTHLWTKVRPSPSLENQPSSNEQALDVLKLSKRLVMCTECGTISLTS